VNPIELRYEIYKALHGRDDVVEVKLDSPTPGAPVSFSVKTWDPYDKVRSFTVSVTEND
jgi:hypothetical protein